jgi:hypothetical protein
LKRTTHDSELTSAPRPALRGPVAAAALLTILLLAAYIASYALLVQRGQISGPGWNKLSHSPEYRYIDSSIARTFYWPVHQVDRRLRRKHWLVSDFGALQSQAHHGRLTDTGGFKALRVQKTSVLKPF